MSEQYRASVRTILSRIESHPEEFKEHFGKWDDIQNAVTDRIAGNKNRLRGITDEEVKAIYDKLQEHIWGAQFDEHVMEKVLDPQREERELDVYKVAVGKGGSGGIGGALIAPQGKKAAQALHGGWTDPHLAQNAIPPGAFNPVAKHQQELQEMYREEMARRAEEMARRAELERKESMMKRLIKKVKI